MAMVFKLTTPPGEIEAILDYFTNPELHAAPDVSDVGKTIMSGLFEPTETVRYEMGRFETPDFSHSNGTPANRWDLALGPDVLYVPVEPSGWLPNARGVLVPDYIHPEAAFRIAQMPKITY